VSGGKRAIQEGCRFCEIVAGSVRSQIVLEDRRSLAFLDNRPLFPGHSLLVPRDHHDTLLDLPEDLLTELFINAQLLAGAMESALEAEGSFVAINNRVSQSVPHLHVHVVPRRRKDGLRGFFWPRHRYRDEEHALETASTLRAAVDRLRAGERAAGGLTNS
jgi:histidine triad (HIT) family protein